MDDLIYLDHHATTPCDPRVVEAMLPYFTQFFGNASSPHEAGTRAAQAVDIAREQVAELIGARPGEIVFTGGATESNNLAILGYARVGIKSTRNQIVTTCIEHKSVLSPCRALEREGFEITVLPVNRDGTVSLEAAHTAITAQTLLVSVQAANGEIGTIQPIAALSDLAHENGAAIHCDAAQAVGKIPVDVTDWNVDFLSLSAHKIYGPKGVGALWVRQPRSANLEPIAYGGGQERNWRPGTVNVPGVVGLGVAARLNLDRMPAESQRLARMRDDFEHLLQVANSRLKMNGDINNRLPHNSSLTFPGIEADILLANLPGIAISSGSACDSGAWTPSTTLTAIGLSREDARSTIRVGFGRSNKETDIVCVSNQISSVLQRIQH